MIGGVDEKEHKEGKQPKPSETRPVAESFGSQWMRRSSITAQRHFLCAVSLGCRCNSTPSDIDQTPKPPPTWSNPSPFWYLPTIVFPSARAANPQDMEGEKKSIIYNVLGFPSRMESTLSNPINSCQTGGWIQCYLWSPVIQAKSSHCLPHLHKKRVWTRAWYSKLAVVYIQTHCSGWVPVC